MEERPEEERHRAMWEGSRVTDPLSRETRVHCPPGTSVCSTPAQGGLRFTTQAVQAAHKLVCLVCGRVNCAVRSLLSLHAGCGHTAADSAVRPSQQTVATAAPLSSWPLAKFYNLRKGWRSWEHCPWRSLDTRFYIRSGNTDIAASRRIRGWKPQGGRLWSNCRNTNAF